MNKVVDLATHPIKKKRDSIRFLERKCPLLKPDLEEYHEEGKVCYGWFDGGCNTCEVPKNNRISYTALTNISAQKD